MENALFEAFRNEFPVTRKFVYLDHAGVAPVSLRVRTAVDRHLAEASEGAAFHYPAWSQRVVDVRRACAKLVGAEPGEIAFVRSTSHGLSIVAHGLDWKSGDNLLVYEKEFPSNLYPWLNLRQRGVEVRFIPSRGGRILFEDIEQLSDSRTRLLAVSSVQFVNGFRLDLKRAGEFCRSRGILFCVDAIQSLGVIPLDVNDSCIDFLSADAHKWLLGPEGIGIFFCRKGLAERLAPPLVGWKSVQDEFNFETPDFRLKTDALRFEEGSSNLMGIFALGAAVELLFEAGLERIADRVHGLGDEIIGQAEKSGFTVLTPRARTDRGGTVTVSGPFAPLRLKDSLLQRGIMVNVRGGGIRISPHFYNTEGELRDLFEAIRDLT